MFRNIDTVNELEIYIFPILLLSYLSLPIINLFITYLSIYLSPIIHLFNIINVSLFFFLLLYIHSLLFTNYLSISLSSLIHAFIPLNTFFLLQHQVEILRCEADIT